jgi:hypothetical protein
LKFHGFGSGEKVDQIVDNFTFINQVNQDDSYVIEEFRLSFNYGFKNLKNRIENLMILDQITFKNFNRYLTVFFEEL